MRTITFYSYKGGVGRSLALANIAIRLAEFGKKVCLLDFDLEAPGLPFKFSNYLDQSDIKKGIVDYIYEFSSKGNLPNQISEYSISFSIGALKEKVSFIPAGNHISRDYWKKLSSINWHELLYSEAGIGIQFLLDLKEKIRREIKPDFLLIDSRTGISEISGVTVSLLADELVIVAANNDENIDGAKRVMQSLMDPENLILGKSPKIFFVLSRIPLMEKPHEKAMEQYLVAKLKRTLSNIYKNEILVIHSDRELELDEQLKINSETDENSASVANDYLKLFAEITKEYLSPDEIKRFNDIKESERLYQLALSKEKEIDQLEFINSAISLNKTNIDFYLFRAQLFADLKDYESAIKDFEFVLALDVKNIDALEGIGDIYHVQEKHNDALKIFDKIIELNPKYSNAYFTKALIYEDLGDIGKQIDNYLKVLEINPNDYSTLNNMANYFKSEKDFQKALEYIYKALEINPQESILYTTLAEIYAEQGKISEFYLNFELALINDRADDDILDALIEEEIYKQFYKEERFIKLLEKYKIVLPEN